MESCTYLFFRASYFRVILEVRLRIYQDQLGAFWYRI